MILAAIFKAAVFLDISLLFSRVFRGVFLGSRVKFYSVRVLAGLNWRMSQEIDCNGYHGYGYCLKGRLGLERLKLKMY